MARYRAAPGPLIAAIAALALLPGAGAIAQSLPEKPPVVAPNGPAQAAAPSAAAPDAAAQGAAQDPVQNSAQNAAPGPAPSGGPAFGPEAPRGGAVAGALSRSGADLPPPPAETVVAGLSQSRVGITVNFDGSEILVYGAVDRHGPAPEGPLDVIVTIEGPARELVVRKKSRQFGIWVNGSALDIDRAPEFYAVTATRPVAEILRPEDDRIYRITLPTAVRALSSSLQVADPEAYTEALMRLRRASGAYVIEENGVSLTRDVLFRADMVLPANLSEGLFLARVFLLREGRVIATEARGIEVHKEGIERFLHRLALDQPAIYGVISLLVAIAAGWLASAAFGYLRR